MIVLAVFFAALALTGIPQRLVTSFVLSSQLDGSANVASISLGNPLTAQGISLASAASQLYGPVVQVERVEAAYRLSPENGRHIERVSVTGLDVSLEQGDTESNFQFLLDRFSPPGGGGDITPWLPERIDLDPIRLNLQFPSFSLTAENLDVHALLERADTGSVRIGAPDAALTWSSALSPVRQSTGNVALDAAWNADGADVDAAIDLSPLARLNGTFSATRRNGLPYYAVSIAEADLGDPVWAAMVNDLSPIPTRFDTLRITDSDVHFHLPSGGPSIDQASVDAAFTGFAVGPLDAPFYSGPLQLALRGNYGAQTEIVGTMTLRERLELEAAFQWTPEGLAGTFGWEPWPRDDLIALTPPAYAGLWETLQPLTRLGAKGTITQGPGTFKLDGNLAAGFGEGAPMDIPLTLAWTMDTGLSNLTVSVETALEQARFKSTTTVPEGGEVRVENMLEGVSPNAWTARILGKEILPGLVAALSGRADIALPASGALAIDLDLASAGLSYGSLALTADTPVKVAGGMVYDNATGKLTGTSLKLSQEGTADLTTSGWSFDLPSASLHAPLEGSLSLDALAGMFALPDLNGDAVLRGTLATGPAQVRFAEFSATSDTIGYGDWIPYDVALALSGSLAYDTAASALRIAPFQIVAGEGTHATFAALDLQFPRDGAATTSTIKGLALVSDLAILARKNWIESAVGGRATIDSEQLAWNGVSLIGPLAWELRADTLLLPEKMGSFSNLAMSGKYNAGSGEAGGGPLSVGPFTIYEIPFGATATDLKVTSEAITCTPFETTFLGGTLVLEAEVKYPEAGLPAKVKAEARTLDLEQFTQTFKPPDVVMTGKVSGTADLAVADGALADLNVDLTASENLTLNQAAVRQILMQQYVNNAVGSKQIQKVIEKVIGKDEQRAFEKAVLNLRLEDGLVVGIARLESKNLDVTVDIKAEPEAILQAIQSTAEETSQNSQ